MKVFTDEEWDYLCSKINFRDSWLDAKAIQIMNKPRIEIATPQIQIEVKPETLK